MHFLKFLVLLIFSLLIVECCIIERNVNEHGFFEPKINRVEIPDSINSAEGSKESKRYTIPAQEIEMNYLLSNILDQIPVLTYVDPQFKFGEKIKEIYNFRLSKFSIPKNPQEYYALELRSEVDPKAISSLDAHAYWCHQGKYVDIPIHPTGDQPKLLFTPTFSGCTMVVDLIEKEINGKSEPVFRVYHVQGKKENAEYNDLTDHGYGMVTSMQYRNYGYYKADVHKPETFTENYIGSAFMAYSEQANKWILYHQSQLNAFQMSISKIASENGVKTITALMPENAEVVKSTLLSVKAIVNEHTVAPYEGARASRRHFVGEASRDWDDRKSNSANANCV